MDDNSFHTSVVIELANQEDSEDQRGYTTEFDEMDIPKDYVIDQIFCGENITVYALFEIPEMKNQKSDVDLTEMQNLATANDFRHIPKSSLKKTVHKKSNTYNRKLLERDSDEDKKWCAKVTNECYRSRSIYCLKQGQNHEIPQREEDSTDLKVLFSKDFISKGSKQMKFKTVSKGVNTDIAQSPKVIEDIQRAINMGFACERSCDKSVEISKIPYSNSSSERIGGDVKQSISSFSTDSECVQHSKGSPPNYLFVPLLMVEERFMSHFQKEEKILATKSRIKPKKMSLGTNTETIDSSPLTSETDERKEHKSHYTTQCEASKVFERSEEKEHKNGKSHLKKKDKNTILNEIRKLQGKLNSLIKSIEYNEISLSTDEDDKYSETSKRTSEAVMKNLNKSSEPQFTDSETFRRNHNRYDDIPIFSSLIVPPAPKSKKVVSKKKAESGDRVEKKPTMDLVKSDSSSCVAQELKILTVQNISVVEKQEVTPKKIFSGLNINWELKTGKSLGSSKSATNSRSSVLLPKYNSLKKSMSFDLQDDKVEIYGLKKIKNSALKFEGSVKTHMRVMQNGEVRLGENLTSLRREMGDEAKTILMSGTESPDFHEDSGKVEVIFLKNGAVDIKKNLNEEEGDAKMIYPNQNLVPQKFVEDQEVHFCRPDGTASDALLNSVKITNTSRGKSKTAKKTDDSGAKACSDTEKSTTPSRTHRKINPVDPYLKKEVSAAKNLNTRIKKFERKETIGGELSKRKSVVGSRKFTVKGTAESKLHVDKLIKLDIESRHDNTNNQKATKANTDEKSGGKPDKLPRPCSQKREHRENAAETTEKKETEKKINKKSDNVVETEPRHQKKSPYTEVIENVEQSKITEIKQEVAPGKDQFHAENSAWLSPNSASVVVELFSEKPTLGEEEFYAEIGEDYGDFRISASPRSKYNESEDQGKRNCGSQEKPIVKSIWALTKVLLYEDGTKKLEVLEASLTPPGYCLNPTENVLE